MHTPAPVFCVLTSGITCEIMGLPQRSPISPRRGSQLNQPVIPGINITSSGRILSPTTKLAALIWAPSGYGKTHLAGSLDALTQKYDGKRTLYIPMEAGEGGGAATIRKLDVPMYIPKNYTDLYKLLGMLRNDKSIGGVVVDSATEMNSQYIKPESLKYPSRENSPTRGIGVSTRSDYQVMGELMSGVLRLLMGLTTHENPDFRKHLVVTAADMTREEDERVTWIGPALPGRMSREATQMFQQVFSMEVKPELVDGKRTLVRYLTTAGDGVRALKDRYGILPERIRLKSHTGDTQGEDLVTLWENFYLKNMSA